MRSAQHARSTQHATSPWVFLGAVGGGIYGFANGLVHGVGDGLDFGFTNMRKVQLHIEFEAVPDAVSADKAASLADASDEKEAPAVQPSSRVAACSAAASGCCCIQ